MAVEWRVTRKLLGIISEQGEGGLEKEDLIKFIRFDKRVIRI